MSKAITRGGSKLAASASAKSSSSGAGIDALCDIAAAADGGDDAAAGQLGQAMQRQILEVEAFSSVHDMIHAAILQHGPPASLKQIYQACEERGRIAYKRTGGSRLITHNDHWKSQIRHALYTSGKFSRVSPGTDAWTISKTFAKTPPSITMVTIIADEEDPAGSVCGEASHVGAGDGTTAGGFSQETSQAPRMSLRNRAQPKRTPNASTRYNRRSANPLGGTEIASRAGSKECMGINFEEDAESVGGHSQSENQTEEPTPARPVQYSIDHALSASPSVTIQDVLSRAVLQTASARCERGSVPDLPQSSLQSPAILAKLAADGGVLKGQQPLEGGAETIGSAQGMALPRSSDAPVEDFLGASGNRLGELCSSHTVLEPGQAAATPIPQIPAPSGRSVEADSPPARGIKRLHADPTASGSVPLKKRLKAAAARAASPVPLPSAEYREPQQAPPAQLGEVNPAKRDLSRNRRKPVRSSKADEPTAADALPVTPLSKGGSLPGAMADEVRTTAKKTRSRPPKPTVQQGRAPVVTPGDLTPNVATPANFAPSAVMYATPLTFPQATPKSGIVTRQRSASRSPDAAGRGSWSQSDPKAFRDAAVAILSNGGQPLGMKDLADRAVQQRLVTAGNLPEHAMASALYIDMEINEASPFTAVWDGRFGLRSWADGR